MTKGNDDDSSSTILGNINDDSHNVFRDLEAFVNIMLKTMDPEEVVILLWHFNERSIGSVLGIAAPVGYLDFLPDLL